MEFHSITQRKLLRTKLEDYFFCAKLLVCYSRKSIASRIVIYWLYSFLLESKNVIPAQNLQNELINLIFFRYSYYYYVLFV